MSRPIIGISMYREPAHWGNWAAVPAHLLPERYAVAVSAAGGTAVLLPPYGPADDIPGLVARLDGLVIAGGSDVNPSRYGQMPNEHTTGWRDDRDVSELALLDAAEDRELPTLGVCRGMQVMAVRAGGELLQHVPDKVGHHGHSPGPDLYGPIEVATVPGTRIAALLGQTLTVPCHHHQAVLAHPGYVQAAHADDGILEAFEKPDLPFWAGIQWHPETGTDVRLFHALVVAAGADA
jgi:putative glutamine amidotransferase